MVGIRTAESVQRLQNIASMTKAGNKMTAKKQVFPIYDWTDNDVWLFLLRNHVDIPEIYLFLWQSGSSKRQMRVSQFFSVDTARSLVKNGSSEENRTLIWLPCIGTARCSAEVPEKGKRRKRDRSREIIGRS